MDIRTFLKDRVLLLDGGMGTLLQAAGLPAGEHPEQWNLTHPEVIRDVHRAYFDAGSNVVNTNTFGANLLKFQGAQLAQIISRAVEHARAAAEASAGTQEKWVALDVGPTGRLIQPFGDLPFEEAVHVFAETMRLGERAGADLIFIETMNDSLETKAALLAAKETTSLPVFVSNAYAQDGRLMNGTSPAAMVAMLESMGADAIGVNCSFGPEALAPVVEEYLRASSIPVLLKPNAGLPSLCEGRTVYDVAPDAFCASVADLVRRGVRAVGGCCGTTPEYIRALSAALVGLAPCEICEKTSTVVSSYTHAVDLGARPILIGERINPTGKKRFKEALVAHDIDYVLKEGLSQAATGVHLLDVNVGHPQIDEPAMLRECVSALQAVCDLPLQLDSSDPEALEAALRVYNGKALINSVNGTEESMRRVFPLAKKYGGVLIALTLDESGIPDCASGRVEIAQKIIARAAEYGIKKRDLVFDPLALTVSADPEAARQTLLAVEQIRTELGCLTSLGVSNVSFGLPLRSVLNAHFYTLALAHGLSCAIVNPYCEEIMKAYHAHLALMGKDTNFEGYLRFSETVSDSAARTVATGGAQTAPRVAETLSEAISRGLTQASVSLTRAALADTPPLTIVQEQIIPALNEIGVAFEEKRAFLPQLLMSAEAASAAFELIRTHARAETAPEAGPPFVLATVKGDIHDIGKNIVRLLLENYGFVVCDLGRDVAPETVLARVLELKAPLCGLSALMTTTVPAMQETVRLLHERAPFCRVIVGGAVLTEQIAADIGADAYAADAMATVRLAQSLPPAR